MKRKFVNKKRVKLISFKKFIIFFIILFSIFMIIISINSGKLINISKKYIEAYSNQYDYNLKYIEIENLTYIERRDILFFFKDFKNKSIFLVPIKKISKEIMQNKWIKNVQIKNNYQNTLKVYIEEEVPLGIYDNNNYKILFSKDLIILEILQDQKKFSKLITFYGQNSILNSKIFLSNFHQSFLNNIEIASYIQNRRWNIYLKNKILLKLPEIDIKDAIKNYKKIYANLSNNDLKEIKSIDLRLENQAIIKYKKYD